MRHLHGATSSEYPPVFISSHSFSLFYLKLYVKQGTDDELIKRALEQGSDCTVMSLYVPSEDDEVIVNNLSLSFAVLSSNMTNLFNFLFLLSYINDNTHQKRLLTKLGCCGAWFHKSCIQKCMDICSTKCPCCNSTKVAGSQLRRLNRANPTPRVQNKRS